MHHQIDWYRREGEEAKAIEWNDLPSSKGDTPTHLLFSFALSAQSTLTTLPFSLPLIELEQHDDSLQLEILSTTLPLHRSGQDESDTVRKWEELCEEDPSYFSSYLDQVAKEMQQLIAERERVLGSLTLLGVSRGAWIAMQLLARLKVSKPLFLLCYAPMTKIAGVEGSSILELHIEHLFQSPFESWISIGNHDTRVSTKESFLTHQFLLEREQAITKQERRVGRYPHHFTSYPSVGYRGHGSPDKVLIAGAHWLKERLKLIHEQPTD